MKFKYLAAAIMAFAVTAPAVAAEGAPKAAPEKEKKICRTELATGSRVRKHRVCMTESEWRELNAQTKKNIDDYTGRMGNREGAGQAGG
ncbi:MAG: hypothetical protein ACO1OD_08065 [Croceibacterium sp.]